MARFPLLTDLRRLVSCALVLLLLATVLIGFVTQKKEPALNLKFSSNAESELKKQQARIKKELASGTSDEWSGEYYYGDGLGVNVAFSMTPKSGFAFTWNGCLGLYDLNYGDVAFENGRYKLKFRYPNKREGFEGIAPDFIPVRWSSRHYLIPSEEFVSFLNAINSGFESAETSRSHRFLLKLGDERTPVTGFPNVPAEYKAYLLNAPIKARISSVGASKDIQDGRVTRVVINVGSADGVKPGMEFYIYKPSTVFEAVEVLNLSEHSAEAEIHQYGSKPPTPNLDWQLSTYPLTGRE